jgi:amino-acid N-acetyltransferase
VREALDLRATKSAADEESSLLDTAVSACRAGVERVHIVNRHVDGAVLRELFTRDGIGTLISSAPFDHLRQAVVEDVAGILELIKPLETRGVLVERSRERLEADIAHFVVMVREGTIVACGALYPYAGQAAGEVASIAVHPDYRGGQFGDVLLEEIEQRAREREIGTLFVLTTQTAQWFNERGFDTCTLESLPIEKLERYDYQRNSAVLVKRLA